MDGPTECSLANAAGFQAGAPPGRAVVAWRHFRLRENFLVAEMRSDKKSVFHEECANFARSRFPVRFRGAGTFGLAHIGMDREFTRIFVAGVR
jgi:hypothetical protein